MPRSKTARTTAPPKQLSGGARMKLAGRHPILIGVEPGELELIRQAAKVDRRPVSQFVLLASLAAAKEKISGNLPDKA